MSWSGASLVVDSTNLGHYSEIKKFEIVDGEEYNYDTVEMVNKPLNEEDNNN